MCGICGVYSTSFGASELRLFKHLLYINNIRGMDSTGVVRINKDKTADILKSTDSSPEFLLHNPAAKTFLTADKVYGYIGHTRAATVGSVSEENAHPFKFQKVIGVHNGTIKKTIRFDRQHETDSEAIYHNLNDHGLVETLKEIASKTSAYALSWVDLPEETLNFVKNKERPLYFTYVYGRHTLAWSSTKSALEFIVDALKLTPDGWDKDTADYFTLTPHDHMSLKIGKPASDASIKHIDVDPEPPYYQVPTKKTKTYSYGNGLEDFYDVDWETDWITELKRKERSSRQLKGSPDGTWRKEGDIWVKTYKQVVSKDAEELPKNLTKNPESSKFRTPPAVTHWGEPQSVPETTFRLKQGCFICGMVTEYEDYIQDKGGVHWYSREAYCCDACYHDPGVRSIYFPDAIEGVHNH